MNQTSLRLRWPLLVLLASIALTAIAAFDAQRAIRAQDAVVGRALNEVVSFASWSYGQHLQDQLGSSAREVLGAVNHGDNLHMNPGVPPANELVHYLPYDPSCECHRTRQGPLPSNFMMLRLGSDRLDVATNTYRAPGEGWNAERGMHDMPMGGVDTREPLGVGGHRQYTAAERRWITDILTRQARAAPPANHGFSFLVGRFNGEPRILSYTLMPTAWGDTIVYSAEYDKTAFSNLLAGVLDGSGLLPATFTHGKRNREVITIRVADHAGDEIFNSGMDSQSPAVSQLTLPEQFGALTLDVAVRPGQGSGFVIGGLPRSRLPLLLGLLLLAAAMSVIAVMQIRRESELAGMRADFVSNVSHELRTPLAQIRLYLETIRTGRASTTAQRDWSLGHIERETTRLGQLVENVLRFSRIGRVDAPPMTDVNVADDVTRIVDEFRPLAAVRRAEIVVEAEDTPPVQLRPDALQRVVVNLLDNAVKYGPAGQTIRVKVELASSDIRIAVSDEGEGVKESERESIWRAFSRGAAASAAAGSGIGLTIVRDVVTQHGGRVWVEDAPGGGARFVVTLPASRFPVPAAPPPLAIAQ
ncbi:MAG TPA: HAMP domain-containing sensor histidine kinase [Gemmatimonadaceae bacterium]|nr:HAMP domain-containing sensor histidine kinase [Gemmatimonadaceae bacterium]